MADTRNRAGRPELEGTRRSSAERRRQAKRAEVTYVRDEFAIDLYAKGESWADISRKVGQQFNMSAHEASVRRMVYRGLERRALEHPESIDVARELLMTQIRKIIEAHMPRALGLAFDGDGLPLSPDTRSGELVLKALDRVAIITGVKAAQPQAPEIGTQINIGVPGSPEQARSLILESLRSESEKHKIVEGHLANVGTSMAELAGELDDDDTPPPPPGVIMGEVVDE